MYVHFVSVIALALRGLFERVISFWSKIRRGTTRLLCATPRIAGAMRPNERSAMSLSEGAAGSHTLSEQYAKWHTDSSTAGLPLADDV
jgi:hypothetical protein